MNSDIGFVIGQCIEDILRKKITSFYGMQGYISQCIALAAAGDDLYGKTRKTAFNPLLHFLQLQNRQPGTPPDEPYLFHSEFY